jgi:hypothetical protein
MAKAFKKLSVKCGEYQNQNGDTKGRWRNVGTLMQGDDGGYFILLDKTFNPAGVPAGDRDSDQVLISTFDLDTDGNDRNKAPF